MTKIVWSRQIKKFHVVSPLFRKCLPAEKLRISSHNYYRYHEIRTVLLKKNTVCEIRFFHFPVFFSNWLLAKQKVNSLLTLEFISLRRNLEMRSKKLKVICAENN